VAGLFQKQGRTQGMAVCTSTSFDLVPSLQDREILGVRFRPKADDRTRRRRPVANRIKIVTITLEMNLAMI
jgi:hypothetical protein